MNQLKKVGISLLILYTLLMGLLYLFQEKLIFRPEPIAKEYTYNFPFAFKEVNLTTADNNTINALYLQAENPKGILLFFHGNKGNLIRWGEITSYFLQFNYDVFVIDYRGYGKSTGTFNESLMYKDALLSYDYVKQHYKEENIVVYGRSLGATFATKVASENNPKHVLLEAPFYNVYHTAKARYKVVPKFLIKYQFNSNQYISKIKSPITIFHGTDDKTTPPEGSKELFKLLTSFKKKLLLLEKGTHHNIRGFKEYQTVIAKILN